MFYNKDLESLILNRHVNNKSNSLTILGGFVTPGVTRELFNKLKSVNNDMQCDVIYGATSSGKPRNYIEHEKFIELTNSSTRNIYYSQKYIHSKIYMWSRDNHPVDILLGSANFSTKGLVNDYQEVLIEPEYSIFTEISDYIKTCLTNSIICTDINYDKDEIQSFETNEILQPIDIKYKNSIRSKVLSYNPSKVRIPLLDKPGHVHEKSGLNWGFGKGHVDKDCSYIKISSDLVKQIPKFFPNNGINENTGSGQAHKNTKYAAEVIFDDGECMQWSFEGYSKTNIYYKQITSYPKKNILGIYFRKRLGLGQYDEITFEHLKNYGKDYIEITNMGDGLYYADLGVKNSKS